MACNSNLLRSILSYPNHCEQICTPITGKNYSGIAKALAIRTNQSNQDHNQSDIVTYGLLSICILQGDLLIGFFIKTQRDTHTHLSGELVKDVAAVGVQNGDGLGEVVSLWRQTGRHTISLDTV